MSDGTIIAVKQLSSKSKQGSREFVNEIGMISALQHPNLVKLYGCCVEGNQLSLIYEYMENNCLSRALFGKLTILVMTYDGGGKMGGWAVRVAGQNEFDFKHVMFSVDRVVYPHFLSFLKKNNYK